MDKRSLVGLLLIVLIVVGFTFLTRPSEEELARAQRQRDSLALVEADRAASQERARRALVVDTLREEVRSLVDSGTASRAPDRDLFLSNDLLQLRISTRGGRIAEALLRGYKTYYGDSLRLFYGEGNRFGLRFWTQTAGVFTHHMQFLPQESGMHLAAKAPGDTARLVMRLHAGADAYIDYIYTLPYGSYAVGYDVELHNMHRVLAPGQQYLDLEWGMRAPQQEKGAKKEGEYTLLAYRTPNGDYEEVMQSDEPVESKVGTSLAWVAFKEQFFSAILRAKGEAGESFRQGEFTLASSGQEGFLKDFSALLMLSYSGDGSDRYSMEWYLGPNHYKTMVGYGQEYESVVPLGGWLIGWINKYVVINVFYWLGRFVDSYGLIILILTVLIKLVLFPLTYKSYKSQAKMRVLKPMVDELGAKYPRSEDAMKKQQAIMGLYKSAGVNPMGGCLPMLVQFPILIAMFRFFPASFELRQESFLWADDLSSYDSVLSLPFKIPFYGDHVSLFTLLMAVALLITSLMSFKQTSSMGGQMKGMQFMMLYMMPLMMLFWFNDYSAGLSYYYFLANVITIAQTLIIRRTVDEKALLARLQSNAKRPVKRSRFMERLERMQKEQQRRAEGRRS